MKRLSVLPHTPEWYEARAERATASNGAVLVVKENAELLQAHAAKKGITLDIAPLLAVGLTSYFEKTPWTLWAENTGRLPRFRGNADTERGQAHEEKILAMFEAKLMTLAERNVTAVSSECDWLLASLDGLAPQSSDYDVAAPNGFPVEVKCPAFPSRRKLWESKKAGHLAVMGLPYYWVQVQHQILVTDAPYGWFVAAGVEADSAGVEKFVFPLDEQVPRDNAFLTAYKAIAKYFYTEFLEPYVEPPMLPADEALLAALEERAAFDRALVQDDTEAAVQLYLTALHEEEAAAVRRKQLEAKLLLAAEKLRAEGADTVTIADKIQVVYGKTTTVSWQKIAKSLAGTVPPALVEKYSSERASVKVKEVKEVS